MRKGSGHLQGTGHTLNISRRGVLFHTEETLSVGSRIEVVIQMGPGLDNPADQISLRVQGVTIRSEGGDVAVSIKKYRLRPSPNGPDLVAVPYPL